MDAIRHRAICLNLATHIESVGNGHSVVFHSTVSLCTASRLPVYLWLGLNTINNQMHSFGLLIGQLLKLTPAEGEDSGMCWGLGFIKGYSRCSFCPAVGLNHNLLHVKKGKKGRFMSCYFLPWQQGAWKSHSLKVSFHHCRVFLAALEMNLVNRLEAWCCFSLNQDSQKRQLDGFCVCCAVHSERGASCIIDELWNASAPYDWALMWAPGDRWQRLEEFCS